MSGPLNASRFIFVELVRHCSLFQREITLKIKSLKYFSEDQFDLVSPAYKYMKMYIVLLLMAGT